MNNLTILTDILEELNPPKKAAAPATWSLFYKNKRLSDVPVSFMLKHLEDLIEQLTLSIIELEEEAEEISVTGYVDEDFEFQCRSDIQHLFRSIMCFGDLKQKTLAMETVLNGWDFSFFPEFSDEISAATVMANSELDEILMKEFDSIIGDADNSIVRANTISTALERSSDNGRRKVLSILQKFDEYHPEVVVVALMSSLKWSELWSDKDRQCIQHILDTDYFGYLGFNEALVKHWRKNHNLEARPSCLSSWKEQREWNFESLVKSLRWFAVQGRWQELYFKYLGRYLNGKNAMQSFWLSVIDFEDTLPLPNYGEIFCKIIEEKSNWVEANFVNEIKRSHQLLVPEEDLEHARTELAIVLMNISAFLSGLGEKFENDSFIRKLNFLEKKIDQHLCQIYSDEKFTFGEDSAEQAQKHRDLITEAKSLWEKEFSEFANKVLEGKHQKQRSEFKIEKTLTKLGIKIVG